MSWSNERIFELIQNYECEPILWNPQDPDYKRKCLNYEAWGRIKANLSWDVTVEELKRKMNSLMAYYRTHLNKYKKSLKPGVSADEVYQTNWFAFSAMNSFLAPVYDCQPIMSTSNVTEENETQKRIDTEDSSTEDKPKVNVVKRPRRELPPEIIKAKQQMQKAFQHVQSLNDEYEMFGKLIAGKIRKLKNHNAKEIVMKDIYNIIFKASMMDPVKQSTLSCQLPSPTPSTSNSPQHEPYYLSCSSSSSQSPHKETHHKRKSHKSSRKLMKNYMND